MSEPFAKLFDTAHGQLLVTTETSDSDASGPCFRIRAASVNGIEAAISHGPWSDDAEGWDRVAELLAQFDQAQADDWAEKLTTMIRNFANSEPQP